MNRRPVRTGIAVLGALALFLTNVGSGCPSEPPAPLPELATTSAVGTLEAATSVTDDGVFTWRAPIPVPPGRAGMEPSLALAYASSPTESSLGVGFRLDGLSSVSRCGQIVAIDGVRRGVHLDEEDRLCLDGARLLAVDGGDLAPGTVYRTEEESWRRVETLSTDAAGITGPVSFRVRLPDGRERRYGATDDSRLVITRSDGQRVVATWYLTDERDPRGNLVQYRYEHVTPTLPHETTEASDPEPPVHDIVRIARIDYTGSWLGDGTVMVSGDRSVRFEYAAAPRVPDVGVAPDTGGLEEAPGPEDGFFHGSYGWPTSTFPLERVRTFVGSELVHELRLVGDDDNAARRHRLSSVQLCANAPAAAGSEPDEGLVCMPPTHFSWRNRSPGGSEAALFDSHDLVLEPAEVTRGQCEADEGAAWEHCDSYWPTVAFDANGDGADDLLYLRQPPTPRFGGRPIERLAVRFGGYRPRAGARLDARDERELPLSWATERDVRLVPDSPARDVTTVASRLQWADALDWNFDGRDDLIVLVPSEDPDLWELVVAVAMGDARFDIASTGLFIPNTVDVEGFEDGPHVGQLDGRFVRRSIETLDLNGDGRSDVMACLNEGTAYDRYFDGRENIRSVAGRWWYALRNPDGSLGVPAAAGQHRLSASAVETNCAYEYGGLPLRATVSPDFPHFDFHTRVLDADGDGMEELLAAPPWFTNRPGLPAPTHNVRRLRWEDGRLLEGWSNVPNERFEVLDLNGDGLHDLLAEHASVVSPELASRVPAESDQVLTVAYISRGDGTFVATLPDVSTGERRRAQIRPHSSTAGVWDREPLPVFAFDLNGDGRGDLLVSHVGADETMATVVRVPDAAYFVRSWATAEVSVLNFLTSVGTTTTPTGLTLAGVQRGQETDPTIAALYEQRLLTMDADGDGALDLVAVPRIGAFPFSVPFDRPRQLRLAHNLRAEPALVERVTDGLGAETVVHYTPLSDSTVYRPSRDCEYPTRCVTDTRYVVQRVWHDDGSEGRAYVEEQHSYQGARTDLLGRGFLGFQRHAVRNTLTGEVVDRRFDNRTRDAATGSYPGAHRPRAVMHYRLDAGGSAVDGSTVFLGTKETFEHGMRVTDAGTHYTVTTSSSTRAYEENRVPLVVIFGGDPFLGLAPLRTVSRTFTYDDFGNLETTTEIITGVPGAAITRRGWTNDPRRWRIGLPDSIVERTSEPDAACSLETRTFYTVDVDLAEVVSVRRTGRRADPAVDRETTFDRDRWGNLAEATTTTASGSRTVSLGYDASGYFVETVTNGLGHVTEVRFDARSGELVRAVDPNGVETSRSLDGFGRLRRQAQSGRGGVELSYELADELGRHRVGLDGDGGEHEVVTYDRLGRAVGGEVRHAFVTSYTRRSFDRLGRLTSESEPFTDPLSTEVALRVRYDYDALGRVRSARGSEGEERRYTYPRNARQVTEVGGGTYTTELDPAGRVLAATEPGALGGAGSRTSYTYCRSGSLRRMRDAGGHETTVEYDDLGRRTFLADPAAGLARFAYDAFDEVVRTEDAASRVSRWERDVLGRVTDVFHDADGVHDHFTFDEARTPSGRPVLGALAAAESGDGVIDTYEYDDLARPVGQSRLVEGLLLRTTQELDRHGRVVSTSYPDALGAGLARVTNVYDRGSGEVTGVTLNGGSVWELRDQEAHGLPSAETLGPIERLTSHTAAGRLETLVSTASIAGGGVLPLQDLAYDHDTRGLLESRTDALAGRNERFVHDALSRLTEVREAGVVRERYGIDALGNLTSTHDARLSYADPLHPQGATEVIGPEGMRLEYDAVGNAYRVGDLTISYSQRNLPRVITGDKVGVVSYRYDAAGSRASKRGRDVDATYFGLYELERRGMTLYERLSIPTPAGVVAQLERSGADGQTASRLRWLLSERQGSTETSWVEGEAPEHHRYDAYGGVLSDAGTVTGQRPSETVSHGYTGHEHEDELGLVNMGGRIYSPRLRRFLTADPIVAVPFGQGLNAYSYVMGDPMNLVDPTGWQAVPTAGGEEEHAINEDAPDDELPSFGARAVVPAPTGAADAPAAERAGAGAAGQAPAATERGGAGPVVIADLSNVADLFDLDLAGYDEGSGRITNFHDAGRSADAMTLLLAERTTVEGRIDVAARRALAAAASLGPGIGEVQDLLLLMDPRAIFDDRVMAGVSLLASAVTVGGAPNFAAGRAVAGGGGARFITSPAGTTLDLHRFQGLTRNPGTIIAGRSGAGRALTGPANSFTVTDGGHALVYGPEGRLAYDVSVSRIKAFEWNQAPNGQWFSRTGSDLKFPEVPHAVLDMLGLR